jgi:NADPH:quinone reductase-like Zn-dependent oxidoreductase
MKAIRLHEPIGTEGLRYEEAPDPVPAFGDVVVRVHACGITPTKLYCRREYLAQPRMSFACP